MRLRQSGRYRAAAMQGPALLRPLSPAELKKSLSSASPYPAPFRPVGANSSATDCTSSVGTIIDLTGLDKILDIDTHREIASVQPGVRISDLAAELAEYGYELAGGHDLVNRTIGGAVAGGSIGPTFGEDGALLASQVDSVKVVTPAGRPIIIRNDQENLMHAFRLSFGMLGVIYEVRLKIRPVRNFSVAHRSCSFEQFGGVSEKLAAADVGLKFFLMPFRDRVYLDIRRHSVDATASHRIPWRMKDWGESTVLPNVVKSLNRIVPVSSIRYRLIDQCSRMTQGIVNNRLVSTGSNATSLGAGGTGDRGPLNYSTWFFPAADFAIVVQAYRDFCLRMRDANGFRCDLPTVGFRIARDRSALLSPSFDEPMIALRAISTQARGWDDFAIDFADFSRHWGGSPLFNQTREVPPDYPGQVFGSRLDFFRKIRRHLDPENRMMNPFLSQYFL